ncbi:hypothetical protein J6590_020338 [Homalodisca vitripennis]|nr:hypothetical protein J6590_020338 [Homalodisca vitripennis]
MPTTTVLFADTFLLPSWELSNVPVWLSYLAHHRALLPFPRCGTMELVELDLVTPETRESMASAGLST